MKLIKKPNWLLAILATTFFSSHSQTCDSYDPNSKVIPPDLNKTIVFQSGRSSTSFSDFQSTVVGQSFKASAPYLTEVSGNFIKTQGATGTLNVKLYVFDNLNKPKHRDRILWSKDVDITVTDWNIIKVDPTIRLKPNLCYYLEFTMPAGVTYKVDYNYNPGGSLFVNGEKQTNYDLDLKISGAFPVSGYDDLNVFSYLNPSTSKNFQCHEIGQTFIATTPFVKKVVFRAGASTGIGVAKIYEFDELSNMRTSKQIGEACRASIQNNFGLSTFDWVASGLNCPHLKVGKKYFVEITKEPSQEFIKNVSGVLTGIHVYASTTDLYPQGGMYVDGKEDINCELQMELTGFDPDARNEIMANSMEDFDGWQWPESYPSFGVQFKATTSYVTTVATNVCQPPAMHIRLYKYSGNVSDPKGTLLKEVLNYPSGGCGMTKLRFDFPVPLIVGDDYYVEFSSTSTTNITIYGTTRTGTDPENYEYGNTFFKNSSGAYSLSATTRPANIIIEGLKTGSIYTGWGIGINEHTGFNYDDYKTRDLNNDTYGKNLMKAEQTNTHNNKSNAFITIGANWKRVGMSWHNEAFKNTWPIDEFFRIQSDKYSADGGVVAILGLSDRLIRSWNINSPELTDKFYELAEDFAAKAAYYAERYKGYPVIWEIFNEAFEESENKAINLNNITNRQLYYLVKLTCEKIKEVDPSAIISTGSISWLSFPISNDLIQKGIGSYIDIYAYHPYFESNPEANLSKWIKTRKVNFAKYTKNRQVPSLISSEFGAGQREALTSDGDGMCSLDYYVNRTGVEAYSVTNKYIGQVFTATGDIHWLKINVAAGSTNLLVKIYDFSGNTNDPKGTQRTSMAQFGAVSADGWATFYSYAPTSTFISGTRYFLELSSNTAGANVTVLGNKISTTHADDYGSSDNQSCAYMSSTGAIGSYTHPDSYTPAGSTVTYYDDLNMQIKKVGVNCVFSYQVNRSGNHTYFNSSYKIVGQVFRAEVEYLKWIKINIGSNTSGMQINLYEWSGNPQNPKGTFVRTVKQFGTAPLNGWAYFKLEDIQIAFKKWQMYYVEFSSQTVGATIQFYGNNEGITNRDDYTISGQTVSYICAYGATTATPVSGDYQKLAGDLNMVVRNAGFVDAGYATAEETPFATLDICAGNSYRRGVETENLQAVYNMRYILNQMKNNVPLSILYKDVDDGSRQGIFFPDKWLSAYVSSYTYHRKPTAIAIQNLSYFFKNALADANFDVNILNATAKTSHVARFEEKNKTLVVAIWKNTAAESSYKDNVTLEVKKSTFTSGVTIVVNNNLTSVNRGIQTPCATNPSLCPNYWWADGSSGTSLYVNNIEVGSMPVIVTIKLP